MQKYRDTVLDSSGNIVIGAIVTAVLAGGGAAVIYSDNGLTVVTQVVSGADGSFFFYAANGRYTITVTPPINTGLPSVTVTDILLEDLTPIGTLSASQIANTPAGNIAATNVQAALNELDTEKALLAGSASQTFSGAPATAAAHFTRSDQITTDPAVYPTYTKPTAWTPNQGAGLTVVGAFSSGGYYTKVGQLVFVTGYVKGATSIAALTNNYICNNLPVAAGNIGQYQIGTAANGTTTYSYGSAVLPNSTDLIASDAIPTTTLISFTITYISL